jgi:hypothetical protein
MHLQNVPCRLFGGDKISKVEEAQRKRALGINVHYTTEDGGHDEIKRPATMVLHNVSMCLA